MTGGEREDEEGKAKQRDGGMEGGRVCETGPLWRGPTNGFPASELEMLTM